MRRILRWTYVAPILAWILLLAQVDSSSIWYFWGAVSLLVISVLASVHHAEVVAHRVGEPFGTIILAVSVTILEASIIVTLMLAGGEGSENYARDTLFSAVMIILNGILGISMVVGARKFKEQTYQTHSVTIALVALVSIIVLTLILPNYTTSIHGPYYSNPQLIFVTFACIVIYGSFIMAQTVRQRHYFLPTENKKNETDSKPVSRSDAWWSLSFLLVCLGAVVFLSKNISPSIESTIVKAGLPKALLGVIIALIILLPEGISAVRAANKNKFQNSINLSLGSAMASIGLSIPTVAILCVWLDIPVSLGLDNKINGFVRIVFTYSYGFS